MRPEDIDSDAFDSAHQMLTQNTPQEELEEVFVSEMTRLLINELARAGVAPIVSNRKRAEKKIEGALRTTQENNREKGLFFLNNRDAVKLALECNLASRMTMSDYPESVKRVTKKFYAIPAQAELPDELKR